MEKFEKCKIAKQSQELVCYSCGEPIKYDSDRPECYCNDCLPMDNKFKQSQSKVLGEKEISNIILEIFQRDNDFPQAQFIMNSLEMATAIHNKMMEG